MKPALLTDPDEPRRAWLVDATAFASHYEPTTGKRLVHYETAVAVQDLAPGMFRFNLSAGGFVPGFEAEAEAGPATPETAGMLALGTVFPAPCVYAPVGPWQSEAKSRQTFNGPAACVRGIYLPAAVVMLRLAAAHSSVTACRLTESFRFGEARAETPRSMPPGERFAPWCVWRFITAWTWSRWHRAEIDTGRKVTLRARWQELSAIGYPHGHKAFERMHRELFPKPTN